MIYREIETTVKQKTGVIYRIAIGLFFVISFAGISSVLAAGYLAFTPPSMNSMAGQSDCQPSQVYNNLDELFCRNIGGTGGTYPAKSTKPYSSISTLLGGNVYEYQPEITIFKDTQYNSEVWRMTDDPGTSPEHNAFGKTPFNSNGSVFAFMSKWSPTRCFLSSGNIKCDWSMWTENIDGSGIKKIALTGSPPVSNLTDYAFHAGWSRNNKNYMYMVYSDGLYQVDISNNFYTTLVQPLPFPDRRKTIISPLSDNDIVMIADYITYTGPVKLYFVRLNMPADSTCYNIGQTSNGGDGSFNTNHRCFYYSINFGINLVPACHSPANEVGYHDIFFRRNSTDSFFLSYGSTGDVGEYAMFEIPLNGNPANIKVAFAGDGEGNLPSCPVPQETSRPYFSHPFWSSDGSKVIYIRTSVSGANDWGIHLRDYSTPSYLRMLTNLKGSAAGGTGGGHCAWDGYDSEWINAGADSWELADTIIRAQTSVAGSAVPIVRVHGRVRTDAYYTNILPDQSPDATKVYFTSNMLSSNDYLVDSYMVVSKKPYPAQSVTATTSSNSVTLNWTPHSISREVKGYHVYRKTDSSAWTDISGLVSGNSYVNTGLSSGVVYYYGVTAEENSRLESDELSNTVKVTVGGSVNNNEAPQGTKNFDLTAPAKVLSFSKQKIADGQFRLTWTKPSDSDIQHYNIYYSVAGNPAASQQRLILSPPSQTNSIIDWQARLDVADDNQFYGITVVDRQGNESLITYPEGAPTGLCPEGQITGSCNCGGSIYQTGYCCGSQYQTTACLDTTSPIISSININSGFDSATITWNTDENADGRVFISSGNNCTGDVNSYWLTPYVKTHTVPVSGLLPLTEYFFCISSSDIAGNNTTTIPQSFTTSSELDTTPPTVNIKSPPSGQVSGTVNIEVEAADVGGSGIKLVSILLGSTILKNFSATPYIYSWDTISVADGTYILTATADDVAGNHNISDNKTIMINNNTSPVVVTDVHAKVIIGNNMVQAVITWTTNKPSNSRVDYTLEDPDNGTYDKTYGDDTSCVGSSGHCVKDSNMVTSHLITLKNLKNYQTYHYQVTSCDSDNHCSH